ncbi:MAG: hypothetical protein IPK66_02745 [Rhodospirillales bacterium]|nr:hypothetical protein [Rhodospirillales bacterium]
MTENLLESSLADAPNPGGSDSQVTAQAAAARGDRPAGLPDKFWDDKSGQVRIDALIKSYLELERKLGTLGNREIPLGPDNYKLIVKNDLMSSDADINKRLHAAGFTQDQAQLVYDLASERMMPMIAELASMFEAENQIDHLVQHFGGEERWREVARQLDAWGRSRLPARVFEALSTTFEGVIAMQRMMEGEEPGLTRDGQGGDGMVTEAGLKQLMRDPRYWRQQDPAVVEKVRDGFRRLYQQKA